MNNIQNIKDMTVKMQNLIDKNDPAQDIKWLDEIYSLTESVSFECQQLQNKIDGVIKLTEELK